MTGLSVQLPMAAETIDGYGLTKTYRDLVQQNLKMILLCIPGERMMEPEFGVGLERYIFEIDSPFLRTNIAQKISEQVGIYMPYLAIEDIEFISPEENEMLDTNYLGITLKYVITPLQEQGQIDVAVFGAQITDPFAGGRRG
jgi:phage baseplate assembly protein W